MNFEYNNQHEEGLPNLDAADMNQEQRKGPSEAVKAQLPKGGFKDEGFLNPESVGYDREQMDLKNMDYLAERLGVSPSTARKIVRDPFGTGFANEGEELFFSKVGRKVMIPKRTADTLVVRQFKKA